MFERCLRGPPDLAQRPHKKIRAMDGALEAEKEEKLRASRRAKRAAPREPSGTSPVTRGVL